MARSGKPDDWAGLSDEKFKLSRKRGRTGGEREEPLGGGGTKKDGSRSLGELRGPFPERGSRKIRESESQKRANDQHIPQKRVSTCKDESLGRHRKK